jgi:drug/metabolite transporter (DMT)-like permease
VTQLAIVARSVIGFGAIGLAFLAVQHLPVGDATVLCGLSPIFTSIGATCLLGEKYGVREFGGVVFSLTGVVMISRPSFLFGGVCNVGVEASVAEIDG